MFHQITAVEVPKVTDTAHHQNIENTLKTALLGYAAINLAQNTDLGKTLAFDMPNEEFTSRTATPATVNALWKSMGNGATMDPLNTEHAVVFLVDPAIINKNRLCTKDTPRTEIPHVSFTPAALEIPHALILANGQTRVAVVRQKLCKDALKSLAAVDETPALVGRADIIRTLSNNGNWCAVFYNKSECCDTVFYSQCTDSRLTVHIEQSLCASDIKSILGANSNVHKHVDLADTGLIRLCRELANTSEEQHVEIVAKHLLEFNYTGNSTITTVFRDTPFLRILALLTKVKALQSWIPKHMSMNFLYRPPASRSVWFPLQDVYSPNVAVFLSFWVLSFDLPKSKWPSSSSQTSLHLASRKILFIGQCRTSSKRLSTITLNLYHGLF